MPSTCTRICYVRDCPGDEQTWHEMCRQLQSLGFDCLLSPDPGPARRAVANACRKHGLRLLMDFTLAAPEAAQTYSNQHTGLRNGSSIGLLGSAFDYLAQCTGDGIAGFRCRTLSVLRPEDWRTLISRVRMTAPACQFMAWTPGLSADHLPSLAGAGFDATFSSLPWWDGRASWLADEHARLQRVAPAYAPIADPDMPGDASRGGQGEPRAQPSARMLAATVAAGGVLVPYGFVDEANRKDIISMNAWIKKRAAMAGQVQMLTGALASVSVLYRAGMGVMINPNERLAAVIDWTSLRARLPRGQAYLEDVQTLAGRDVPLLTQRASLPAGAAILFIASTPAPVRNAVAVKSKRRTAVISPALRIAIENVEPTVGSGRFEAKCIAGEALPVYADILMDGHDQLAARVLWRAADEKYWHEECMAPIGNDRWVAAFTPVRVGKHYYTIQAWRDTWATHRDQLEKKRAAGRDVALELEEGRLLVMAAYKRVRSRDADLAAALDQLVRHWDLRAMLSPATASAMSAADTHAYKTADTVHYPVMADRREAAYASWYELFPRSCGPAPNQHGRFADVIARLPAIRDMGFDVLYFPPIHPIGMSHRKGKNNAVTANAGDPGSPYAIGSEQGGHTAVHPELGSLQDFQALLKCARLHDLEIALDFAIQCSPDHPWLVQHPEWFAWRPDGSLQYAENPPKRYEDIVNPDFYSTRASALQQRALWQSLRDIVVFWIEQGVRIFRVDNPHTKPLPFWEWMIAEVKNTHPDTLFLSEAFTRPKMMYRLAKLGFSQSYTYFTWRNGKQELADYLTELNAPPVSNFFRPNFFVNTPDINPYFLQSSGRPGFLIRAALAATLSGLWGMYSGFELCEAQAIPGREEYLDSEKYELRARDWNQPGNIIAEITRLNQIRRTNPALQTHLGIRFHHVDDGRILFFSKTSRAGDNVVLALISLDPYAAREATLELPLWEWGLADDARLDLQDMSDDHLFSLYGKYHRVALSPEHPYLLWRRVQSL